MNATFLSPEGMFSFWNIGLGLPREDSDIRSSFLRIEVRFILLMFSLASYPRLMVGLGSSGVGFPSITCFEHTRESFDCDQSFPFFLGSCRFIRFFHNALFQYLSLQLGKEKGQTQLCKYSTLVLSCYHVPCRAVSSISQSCMVHFHNHLLHSDMPCLFLSATFTRKKVLPSNKLQSRARAVGTVKLCIGYTQRH